MDIDDEELDRCLLVIPKCYVYKIPPKTSAALGYRAADWNVKQPNWTGRLEVLARDAKCRINFIDENGNLFATAPVSSTNPKESVEKVTDSGRYFVVRIAAGNKTANIGVGFADRAESFDFRSTIQDWETRAAEEADALSRPIDRGPQKDMSLKGTITVKAPVISSRKKSGGAGKTSSGLAPATSFAAPSNGALLAPPPATGGRRRRGNRAQQPQQQQQQQQPVGGGLLSFGAPAPAPAPAPAGGIGDFDFGDIPSVAAPAPVQAPAPAADDPFAMF